MFRPIAALGAAALLTVFLPAAAFAASPSSESMSCAGVGSSSYATSGIVTADRAVVTPGGTIEVTWQDGYFTPVTPVTVSLSGDGAAGASIVGNPAGVAQVSSSSSTSGALVVQVAVASDASGSLVVNASSDGACGGVTVQVESTRTASIADPSLAYTGGSLAMPIVVAGGGALVFGAIGLTFARVSARRRARS